ncbi:MAG TPA: hypothetical protein DG754_02495 [Bacteroidales bacterium]|jgi:hypothetical protein|nr:hypothetical protein [Bacteroidales bacterium]
MSLILLLPTAGFSSADSLERSKLLPHYVKLQYAGGIGFISPGIGYTFFDSRLDVTAFYGFVPKSIAKNSINSLSIQATSKLFEFAYGDILVHPFNLGFFLHYTFGSDYWVNLPSQYPDSYYWWSPGRMGGVFLGGEIKTKLFANKTPSAGTAFYFRVGSRVLYMVSLYGNEQTLNLSDILELGFGVAIYR